MKSRNVVFLSLLILILEGTFFQNLRIMEISPNVSLVVLITLTLIYGDREGYIFAVTEGLLRDVIYEHSLGLNAIIFVMIVYILSHIEPKLYKENYLNACVIGILATFFYNCSYYILSIITDLKLDTGSFFKLLSIESIFNAFLTYVLYKWLYKAILRKKVNNG